MFLDRFFGKGGAKRGSSSRRRAAKRYFAANGLGLRTEPLEDRTLLSISPGQVGPMQDNHVAALTASAVAGSTSGTCADASGSESSDSDAGESDSANVVSSAASRVTVSASTDSSSSTTSGTVTHYVMLIPSGATIGTAVTVQIVAENDNNHQVSGFSGTADLTSSDGSATLPSTVTFANGHATAQVTFGTAGQQTVTATDNSDSSITGVATTNVATPDVATHFVVLMPSGATTGKPVTVKVVAEDAQNFIVKNFSGTADLTSSDGSATLPTSVTFNNGHASFQATFATTGTQTITATDSSDSTLRGTASTNVVAPAAATHYVLYITQGASVGSPVTVQILAEDSQNHEATSYSGTANLSSSDGSATLPSTVTFTKGHASFQVTFATSGPQSVTATDASDASITGLATTSVAIPHYVLVLPSGVTAGTAVTVTMLAQDAENHLLSTYAGTANLTTSDAAATIPASVTFSGGKATFQVTFATTGQQTITATDSASGSPVGTATTNVAAADTVTHFVVSLSPGATEGTPVTVRVVAEDAQNHIVSNFTGTVDISSSDAGATLPASVTFTNGKAAFFQATFATPGLQTITVTDSSDSSITGVGSTNVATPAVVTHYVVSIRPGVADGMSVTVHLVAEDAENHVVSDYNGTANLSTTDGTATLPTSVTFVNGRATFQMTFATQGQQSVTATDSGSSSIAGTGTTYVGDQSGYGWLGGFGFDLGNFFSRFRR
jgi:hypothetical protein